MKTSKILFGALALLSLAACSDDKDGGNAPESKSSAKIRVNIVANPGSRAGDDDFEDGSEAENTIKSAYLVFYGANKNPITSVLVGESDIKDATLVESPNVELVKTIEAEISLPDGLYPSYMMVYANPINGTAVINDPITYASVKEQKRTTYKNANGFTMNNAVYYDGDGKLQREVAVSKANFWTDESEKNAAPAVTVYLERMAGKVTLQSGNGDTDQITEKQKGTLDGKQLEFTVTGWGINAEAKECYLTKVFQTSADAPWSYNALNSTVDGSFDWNDPARHRSYWAFTPHFYKNESNKTGNSVYYPWVTDQVNTGVNYLKYNSFNDLKKGVVGTSYYTLENTIQVSHYNAGDINVNAALVSAVVTGQYTIDGEAQTFYVHGNKIYLADEYRAAMASLAGCIVNANGTVLTDDQKADLKDLFSIVHPTTPIGTEADKGVEENKVTINFINNSTNRTNFKYKSGTSAAQEIVSGTAGEGQISVVEVNRQLQTLCGLASAYTDGLAYFNVPIRHLGRYNETEKLWNVGAFGVVRNHHYVVNVSGFAVLDFATLGKGVLDPEDPVVPPTDPNDKFGIKADVRVLSWRLVNQNVTLGNSKEDNK